MTVENYAFVHSADQKIVHTQAIMPTFQTRAAQLESNIVQPFLFLPPPPPRRQHLSTHTHTTEMLHRNTYLNHFLVKKRRGVQGGASDQACSPPRPGGSGGSSAGPV